MSEIVTASEINLRRQGEAMSAIDKMRTDLGMSLTETARLGRVAAASYVQWSARSRDPGLSRFVRLAKAFGFEVVMTGHDVEFDLLDVPAAMNAIALQRKARGWVLAEMADRSGVSVNCFYYWRSMKRDPSLSNFIALAETFGFTVIMRRREDALAVSEGSSR